MDEKKKQPGDLNWLDMIRSPHEFVTLVKKRYASYQAFKELTDHVAEKVDPSIKTINGYRKRLRSPLLQCQAHCKKIVAQIPGPILLDSPDYSSDPLINAAFLGHDKITPLLRQADALQISPQEEAEKRVALLTMAHNERDTFGALREGQMVIADARLKSVTFSDHKIVGIATTLEDSRRRLENVIFEVIIESASREIADHRADLGELQVQREKLKAMLKLFGESDSRIEIQENETEEKIDKVKILLKETENILSSAKTSAETPKDRLNFLVDYLSRPENVMDIQLVSLRLDWRNVITNNPEIPANTIRFAQCTIHEEAKRDAVLIAYSLERKAEK